MASWGAYETVREISQHPLGAVWIAHATGSVTEAADRYVIKTTESSWQLGDSDREANETQLFVDAASEQKRLFEAGAKRLVRVHDVGREQAGAYAVYDFYPRSAQRFILGKVKLEGRVIRAIIEGVVDGLIQLRDLGGGRAHGDLKPSNVLLTGIASDQSVSPDQVFIGDIRPKAGLKPQDVTQDVRDVGRLIYQLVTHKPVRDSAAWSATMSEEWQRLGPDGLWWFDFCSRLIDAGAGKPVPSLDAIREELAAYKPRSAGGKGKWIGIAAAAVLVVAAGAVFVVTRGGGQKGGGGEAKEVAPAPGEWAIVKSRFGPWLSRVEGADASFDAARLAKEDPLAAVKQAIPRAMPLRMAISNDRPEQEGLQSGRDSAELIEKNLTAWAVRAKEIGAAWQQRSWSFGGEYVGQANQLARVLSHEKPEEEQQRREWGKSLFEKSPGESRGMTLPELWTLWPQVAEIERQYTAALAASEKLGAVEDRVLSKRDAILASVVLPLTRPTRPDADVLNDVLSHLNDFAKRLRDVSDLLADPNWRRDEFQTKDIAKNEPEKVDLDLLTTWLEVAAPLSEPPLPAKDDPRDKTWQQQIATLSDSLGELAKKATDELSDDEQRELTVSAQRLGAMGKDVEELAATRWIQSNRDKVESRSREVRQTLAATTQLIARTNKALAGSVEGAIDAARSKFGDSKPIAALWNRRIDARLNELKSPGLTSKQVRATLAKDEEWVNLLAGSFGVQLTEAKKAVVGARAPDIEAVLASESAARVATAVSGLKFLDDLQSESAKKAIGTFTAWRDQATDMLADHARVEAMLAEAFQPEDAISGDGTLAATIEKWSKSDGLFAKSPDLVVRVRGELDAINKLKAAAPEVLAAVVNDQSAASRIGRRWGAWRALAGKPAWPASPQQLTDARRVFETARVMIKTLPEARAASLSAQLTADAVAMWSGVASRTSSYADLDQVLRVGPDFGVTITVAEAEKQAAAVFAKDPALQFRVLVALVLRDAGNALEGKSDDEQRAIIGVINTRLTAAAGTLGQAERAKQLVEKLGKASQGEAKFDPTLPTSPVRASLFGTRVPVSVAAGAVDGGPVIYLFKGPRTGRAYELEFLPVEVAGAAGPQRTFVMTTEVSLGLVMDILAGTAAPQDADALAKGPSILNMWSTDKRALTQDRVRGIWPWTQEDVGKPISLNKADAKADGAGKYTRLRADGWYAPPVRNGLPEAFDKPEGGGILAPGVGPISLVGLDVPMQQIPGSDAVLIAKLLGCRIPSPAEWSKALEASGGAAEKPNVRDGWFKTQYDYVAGVNEKFTKQVKKTFPLPNDGIAYPAEGGFDVADKGDPVTADSDGVVFFRDAGNDKPAGGFRNLEGNVAEWVFDNSAELDAIATASIGGTAGAVRDVLLPDAKAARCKVIGGSALSGGWSRTQAVQPNYNVLKKGPGVLGFADVGFRLAFTAAGATKSPAEQAREAMREFFASK